MDIVLKQLLPMIVDGFDLFVFNSNDETPFDLAQSLDSTSLTATYMKQTAQSIWNEVGVEITWLLFYQCPQLPMEMISLIGEYAPTKVTFKN